MASIFMTGLIQMIILFHLLIVLQLILYTMVWAGRLTNIQEIYVFEAISIFINLLLLLVILQKANYVKQVFPEQILNAVLWLFVGIFALNTIGNLFSKNEAELILGTAATFLSSILCWLIVRKPNPAHSKK